MDKLDLHSVADLTKYALQEGLTSLYRLIAYPVEAEPGLSFRPLLS